MSEFLKANEIIKKAMRSKEDFDFKTKLQVLDQIIATTRQGNPYLILIMRDSTSELRNIKKWINEGEQLKNLQDYFDVGSIFEVIGKYDKKYNSITIHSANKLKVGEFDLSDFIKLPFINEKMLVEKLFEAISKIKNNYLKELLEIIFNEKEIREKFFECPASITIHHPYKCGNLEHCIGMITVFENFESFYNKNSNLDTDLIYTGIILHDIGKIYEYSIYNGIPNREVEFAMLGHHALGDQLVSRFISGIHDFPKDLENRIRHIILSHHGRKEWGSPVEPQFPEAEIIHYLDMIDSRFKSNP